MEQNEIATLKTTISSLEYHFSKYQEYEYKSRNESRKPNRDKAHSSMISSAEYIENLLTSYPAYNIIKNGNPFQFENFWRYVESDMSDYLKALKTHLEKLEIKDSEK